MTRLLIVDDEAMIREDLASSFSQQFDEIDEAEDGEEGLRRALRTRPDLIITDFRMPKRNGLELIHGLREAGSEVPVVMLTAFGEKNVAICGMRLGLLDILEKPLRPSIIVAAVRTISEIRRREQELGVLRLERRWDRVLRSERMIALYRLSLQKLLNGSVESAVAESETGSEVTPRPAPWPRR